MLRDLCLHFRGQGRHLSPQKCPDTKRHRLALDTPLPIFEVMPYAGQWVVDLFIQPLHSCRNVLTVSPQNGNNQPGLGWEMVVNARLSNLDRLSDVGIAKSGIPPINQEEIRCLKNSFRSLALHVHETTN